MGRGAVVVALVGAAALAALGPASAQQRPLARMPVAAPAPAPTIAALQLSGAQVDLLRRTLDNAPAHGFEPGAFAPRGGDQAALVSATLRYARAVHSGRLQEANFPYDWGLRPAAFDPAPGFAAAVAQDRLKAWLDGLPPPYTGYQALQKALGRYRQIQTQGGWAPVPAIDLKLGASGPVVEVLRARLALEDGSVPNETAVVPERPPGAPPVAGALTPGTPVFDQALAEAVKRAQRRFGIEPTGIVGLATRTALNVPVERRVEQITANMERWRWLPPELPGHRVQVNIAAAVLTVFEGDAPVMSMRAVTGKPGSETPMLHSRIESIVLNPPWNVPAGIAAKELFPKGRAYLASAGFRILPGGGLQQAPGPGSALGQVKFDFANPYSVYLHDTPSKGRFASYSRLASHGCVRVEKPIALARLMLEGDSFWTPDQIDATIAAGKTVRAKVADPVDVFLLYWTAYVTADGGVNFRADPYGWDTLLIQRLALQGAQI